MGVAHATGTLLIRVYTPSPIFQYCEWDTSGARGATGLQAEQVVMGQSAANTGLDSRVVYKERPAKNFIRLSEGAIKDRQNTTKRIKTDGP